MPLCLKLSMIFKISASELLAISPTIFGSGLVVLFFSVVFFLTGAI